MKNEDSEWESRVATLWAELDETDDNDFIRRIDALVGELPPGSGIGFFERAAAFDSTGHPDQAVPLYQASLDAGLDGERRRRAVIQMASSLRNLGDPEAAVRLLTAEAERTSDALDGAVATFLALALVDLGREREAVAVALKAISSYLPRYKRSVQRYAAALTEGSESQS